MNDITYTFNQTSKERKALVPSALKRTNGSRSGKCTLPHDHLTPAQRKKLDGPVREYNLKKPMGWEEFKILPLDLQEKYLADISEHFGVGSSRIATVLFHRSDMAIPVHCKRWGIRYPIKAGRISYEDQETFKLWAQGKTQWDADLLTDTTEPVESVKPVSSVITDNPTIRSALTSVTLRLAGERDAMLEAISSVIGSSTVELEVTIKFKEENK
jgi:hypothetical protein